MLQILIVKYSVSWGKKEKKAAKSNIKKPNWLNEREVRRKSIKFSEIKQSS